MNIRGAGASRSGSGNGPVAGSGCLVIGPSSTDPL
ncbi:hypothetical protein OPIT5_00630 [Opitutaceae bacterium TAV5]|nr:hypothetical protein OPIT5_00630 [Opitutaceae bacterium TAV5]